MSKTGAKITDPYDTSTTTDSGGRPIGPAGPAISDLQNRAVYLG